MAKIGYWADKYVVMKRSAQEAMKLIKSGQRVFIGSSGGEPQHLVRALCEATERLTDLEIVRLLALETGPAPPERAAPARAPARPRLPGRPLRR